MKKVNNVSILLSVLLILAIQYACSRPNDADFITCVRTREDFLKKSLYEDNELLSRSDFRLDANPLDDQIQVYHSFQYLDDTVNKHDNQLLRAVYLYYKDKKLNQISYSYALSIEDDDLMEYLKFLDKVEGFNCIKFTDLLLVKDRIQIYKSGYSITAELIKSVFWNIHYTITIEK